MKKLVFAALIILAATAPAHAVTTLQGYYEARTELWGQGGGGEYQPWHLTTPVHYLELRVLTTPWKDVEGFVELATASDRWIFEQTTRDERVFMSEGHIRFRSSKAEIYLFSQQNRFWFSEPFLEIINADRVKNDFWGPRAQGIRMDFWDLYGFGGLAYYADQLQAGTDDYRAARIYRHLLDGDIVLGGTYARKDYGTAENEYDEVFAGDIQVAFGNIVEPLSGLGRVTWGLEAGKNISGWLWGVDDAMPIGAFSEIRDIRYGPFSVRGSWQYYEPNFYTGMSSRENDDDYKGYYFEAHYRLPKKAINLKFSRYRYDAFEQETAAGERFFKQQYLGEIYAEFLYGFTGKVEYRWYQDHNGTYPNLFFELVGRNKLMSIRPQFRIKDIDTIYQIEAYGVEFNINIGEWAKLYSRIMNANEDTESRASVFTQLRFDAWSGSEFFVEFGNPDHNNDLVNDDDFVKWDLDNDIQEYFKLFLKVYF
jgi:hypothetical protein